MSRKKIDALILAGGKSSRMGGKHKGNLQICGESFVQHLITELKEETDQIWISYGAEIHETYENCRIVTDIYRNCGPIGGIHAGLMQIEAEYIFVVACDMPFVKPALMRELESYMTEETDAVVPVSGGRIHPLAGIYKKRILSVIEEQMEKEEYRLVALLEKVNTGYVEITEEKTGSMLRNINTIEEYKEIR